jgi:hypothetical protein
MLLGCIASQEMNIQIYSTNGATVRRCYSSTPSLSAPFPEIFGDDQESGNLPKESVRAAVTALSIEPKQEADKNVRNARVRDKRLLHIARETGS